MQYFLIKGLPKVLNKLNKNWLEFFNTGSGILIK